MASDAINPLKRLMARDVVALVAVSDKDIYPDGDWKGFVFGMSDPEKACAIFSTARYNNVYEDNLSEDQE
eukprot:CAMPEP_0116882716 /NCGR_PEP_ID=MMETSP0463-20121206/15069_1 /TAXON_ID=181622 /ORGANISM="Strombidinopsis sp, Strain SopsisLIS2011" /LENGTH=69 /DNA_ID=CAMNT_0004536421 /DNA_START=488 /DNA_END=697 /DNA_ORIENTATION=+